MANPVIVMSKEAFMSLRVAGGAGNGPIEVCDLSSIPTDNRESVIEGMVEIELVPTGRSLKENLKIITGGEARG